MPFIDRDGVSIRYEVHGRGPPLLLTHSYGATMRMWDRQVAHLADRHRIILWDMRGHGGSGDPVDPAAYSQALTVGDMAALLDACDIERAVIGGIGLGGRMSLAFHFDHPDRVGALILSGTVPGFPQPRIAHGVEFPRPNPRRTPSRSRGWRRSVVGKRCALPSTARRSGSRPPRAAWSCRTISLLVDSLPAIPVPTLVIVGSNDGDHFAASNMMTATIPGARRVVLQGAGAIPNIDHPLAFNRAVDAFIDRLRSRRRRRSAAQQTQPVPSATAGWVAYR